MQAGVHLADRAAGGPSGPPALALHAARLHLCRLLLQPPAVLAPTDRVAFAALVATFLLMVFALLIVFGVVLPAGLVVAGALLPAGAAPRRRLRDGALVLPQEGEAVARGGRREGRTRRRRARSRPSTSDIILDITHTEH